MKLQFSSFSVVQLLLSILAFHLFSSVYGDQLSLTHLLTIKNETINGTNSGRFDALIIDDTWPMRNNNDDDDGAQITENGWPVPIRMCRYEENCCVGPNCLQLDPRGEVNVEDLLTDKKEENPDEEKPLYKSKTLFKRKKRAAGKRGGGHHRKSGGSSVLRGANGRFKNGKRSSGSSPPRRRPPQRAAATRALSSYSKPRSASTFKKSTVSSLKSRPRLTAQKHTLKPSPSFKSQRKASVGSQLAQNKLTLGEKSSASPSSSLTGKRNQNPKSSSSSATPTRHHLTLSSSQSGKNKPTSQLKPETIKPNKNLKTVIKDGSSARFPTREVQTNPKAGGRIEFQASEISAEHLGKGTSTNLSARKRSKSLGARPESDQTGHLLGASLGGRGVKDNTFPQNAKMNQGQWKSMESIIANDAKKHGTVKLSQQLKYGDKAQPGRPTEMRFKVETEGGKLIRYGSVDNPTLPRPADGG